VKNQNRIWAKASWYKLYAELMNDWVRVYTFNREYKACLAVQLLADNDIEAVILNKMDSIYQDGEIEIHVHTDQVIRAKMLLNEFEK
jgi:hypothetical protein